METADRISKIIVTNYGRMIVAKWDTHQSRCLEATGRALGDTERLYRWLKEATKAREGMPVFLDIGANIGGYTAALQPYCGRIIAFEAQRILANMLCGTVALNSWPNVFVQNVALGQTFGRIEVPQFDYSKPLSFGSIEFGPQQREPLAQERGRDPDRVEFVPMFPLDQYELDRVDVIKLDVEGMETDVLLGARETIRRCRPRMVVEWIKSDPAVLTALLVDMGYAVETDGMDLICEPLPIEAAEQPPVLVKPNGRPGAGAYFNKIQVALQCLEDVEDPDRFSRTNHLLLRAIAEKPDDAEAHIALGQNLLRQGQWDAGWEELLWISEIPAIAAQVPPRKLPIWNGMDIPTGRILIVSDGGIGDAIMFGRFLEFVSDCCDEVVFAAFDGMGAFWRERLPLAGVTVIEKENDVGDVDAYARLSSLPYIIRARDHLISANGGAYLLKSGERERAAVPRRIGIAWKGNPLHPNDPRRSVAPSYFNEIARICAQKEIELYHLQPARSEADVLAIGGLITPLSEGSTWSDTASLIEAMDLVISVDTAVVHLAGALGVPTWVAVPTPGDWRWGWYGFATHWYGAVRVYRQKRPSDWVGVFARITADLTQMV